MSFTQYKQARARLQRSELAVPGSSPGMFEKAAKSEADYIFLDCEDAVVPDDKVQARKNIIEALNDIDWGDKTMSVRINGLQAKLFFIQGGLHEMMVLAFSHEASGAIVGSRAARTDLHDSFVFLHVKRNDMRAEIGQDSMPDQRLPERLRLTFCDTPLRPLVVTVDREGGMMAGDNLVANLVMFGQYQVQPIAFDVAGAA